MDLSRRLERLERSVDARRPAGECGLVEWRKLAPGEALPICGEHVSGCWLRISPEVLAETARLLVECGSDGTLEEALERMGRPEGGTAPLWPLPIEEARALLGLGEDQGAGHG